MNTIKLNLGCGNYPKSGYVNLDIDSPYADFKHDLNVFPYPFKENEFDIIEADHVLEHLENPFKVMTELKRIAKNNAKIIIKVPHFSRGFTHADHKRGFDISFPLYFNPTFEGGYTGTELKLEKMRLKWFAQSYLKKKIIPSWKYNAGYVLGDLIDFYANLSPTFCSRIWCFWAGGFEEIEFKFKVKK